MVKVINISKVDPGVLLLTVANNAEHLTPEMQKAIADFMRIWSAPVYSNVNIKDLRKAMQ